MPKMTRMLPMLALLPLLAACEELNTVAVEQPAPVFPAPQVAPAPAPAPAVEPSARLSTPAPVASAPIGSTASASAASSAPSPAAPAPGPQAVVASAPQENVSAPPVVLDALLPGTPPSAVFQNGDGCYLFSIERTEPLSGYPVRDSTGTPLCENDDGTVGPRPAS